VQRRAPRQYSRPSAHRRNASTAGASAVVIPRKRTGEFRLGKDLLLAQRQGRLRLV